MIDAAKIKVKIVPVKFSEKEELLMGFSRRQIISFAAAIAAVAAEIYFLHNYIDNDYLGILAMLTGFIIVCTFGFKVRGQSLTSYLFKSITKPSDIYKYSAGGDTLETVEEEKEQSLDFIKIDDDKKGNNNKGKKKKNSKPILKVGKSTQSLIPFLEVYEDGVFKTGENTYCIIGEFTSIKYVGENATEKEMKYQGYKNILNSLSPRFAYQELIVNEEIENVEYEEAIVPDIDIAQSESERAIFEDLANVQRDFIQRSVSKNARKRNYIVLSYTVTSRVDNYEKLFNQFAILKEGFSAIGSELTQLNVVEVLEVVYKINHPFDKTPFQIPDNYARLGRNLKDYIAPMAMNFKGNHIEVGTDYAAVMGIINLTTDQMITDDIINNFLDNKYKVIVSKHLRKVEKAVAIKRLTKRQTSELQKQGDRETQNAKTGMTIMPYGIQKRVADYTNQLAELNNPEEELFELVTLIMVAAETKEEMDEICKMLKERASSENRVKVEFLSQSQKNAYVSILPFAKCAFANGSDEALCMHMLTKGCGVFIPFASQIFFDKQGINYGINETSNYLTVLDRRKGINANGVVLAQSGGGKSFDSKMEDLQIYWKHPNDTIVIIDPEGEYGKILKFIDGEEIDFEPISDTHINILEVTESEMKREDFTFAQMLTEKQEAVAALLETMKGESATAYEVAIIHSVIVSIFEKFKETRDFVNDVPTLDGAFRDKLKDLATNGNDSEKATADDILKIFECYLDEGSMLCGRSTVDYSKRFIVLNVQKCKGRWANIANTLMLSLCDEISAKLYLEKKSMWLKVDEMQTFFVTDSHKETDKTGEYLQNAFARYRKLHHYVEGITQNATLMLESSTARTMLSNATFIKLFRQSPKDLETLSKMYGLTEEQQRYLSKAKSGQGLIIFEGHTIKFNNRIDRNTLTYKLLETSAKESNI